jgi:branched-subunit amino acid ABC-type transport system permease component
VVAVGALVDTLIALVGALADTLIAVVDSCMSYQHTEDMMRIVVVVVVVVWEPNILMIEREHYRILVVMVDS